MKPLHNFKTHPISYRPIQCKILFENCAGHQVLGSFFKLVSETFSCDAYLIFRKSQRIARRSILGHFVKYKKIKDIMKQWIVEYGTKGQPFLSAVYNRETWTETCIGIINNMIVESQLLGGIDLHETNLECKLGNDDLELMWCRTFYQHKDKMKSGLALSTMQQLMKSGK